MSSGTGIDALDDALNVVTQVSTLGLVGYNGEKGLSQGKVTSTTLEGAKELTGANAAEEANRLARQQYEDQVLAARTDRENMLLQNKQRQITASNAATASRNSANNTSNINSQRFTGDVSDYLGL